MIYDRVRNLESAPYPTANEDSVFELLRTYLENNPKTGYLIFQVTQETPLHGIMPVSDAKVTVSKLLGNNFYVSKVIKTGSDGKTPPIPLPTVDGGLSTIPGDSMVYSTYSARVEASGFTNTDIFGIQVFDSIKSIQPVTLKPITINSTTNTYKTEPQNLCK